MPTKPIPDAYRSATPYIIVNGASRAIDFYKAAFSATEQVRLPVQFQRCAFLNPRRAFSRVTE